jgi:hypothetical protein
MHLLRYTTTECIVCSSSILSCASASLVMLSLLVLQSHVLCKSEFYEFGARDLFRERKNIIYGYLIS